MTQPFTSLPFSLRPAHWLLTASAALALSACGFTGGHAPVENRSIGRGPVPTIRRVDPSTLPGYEFTGKPGYYTVQQGDTIRSISRALNIDWNDLARWNSGWVSNPDVIEVGQVLRVVPPTSAGTAPVVAVPPPATTTPGATASALPSVQLQQPPARPPADTASSGATPNIGTSLAWPTRSTTIIAPFDEAKNKGIGIGGKEGDPVFASAAGKVMYAGSGLVGYGNLVLIKHNNTLLTVYAHNSRLMVKEGDSVTKGQQIAAMGKTGTDRVKLHYEVRRNGKTVNPLLYLPH